MLQQQNASLKKLIENDFQFEKIVGKSKEIQEVVNEVSDHLQELNVNFDSVSIFIYYENTNDLEIWSTATQMAEYNNRFFIPYFKHPIPILEYILKVNDKYSGFFTHHYSKKEKDDWWSYVFDHTEFSRVPEERKRFILNSSCFTHSIAGVKHTALQLNSYSRDSFSERENEILKQFARVFEQAYVRFLDLQKAEIQAHEALKQSSLDRVRGQIASMRSKEDLNRITPVIWEELKSLPVQTVILK